MKFTLLKWIGFFALTLIYKTCKIEIKGQEYFDKTYQNGKPTLLCVWHGRMLFPIYYVKSKNLSPWAIASPYRDGAIIASILQKWNINIIWGSSNRNAKQVSKTMSSIFEEDKNAVVCITNDGPKGPRHIAKKGSLEIAKKFDADILTITGHSSKFWKFGSWDEFILPKPFSKIIILVAPQYVHNNNDIVKSVSSYMIKYEQKANDYINK